MRGEQVSTEIEDFLWGSRLVDEFTSVADRVESVANLCGDVRAIRSCGNPYMGLFKGCEETNPPSPLD